MNRRIYSKSVAPHNQRVATDIGIPTDRVDKFIELMNFYEARKDTIKLLYNPHLTGNKVRTSGNLKFVSKGYSANSVQRELGAELIPDASRWFNIDNDPYYNKGALTISGGLLNGTSTNSYFGQLYILTVGKKYQVSFEIKSITSGGFRVEAGLPTAVNATTVGVHTYTATAIGTTLWFYATNFTGTIDNISVREVLSNDLSQTTWTSQPPLCGNIAPTETLGIKNPNGGSNYLTHPTISFGANDTWSVTTVICSEGYTANLGGRCYCKGSGSNSQNSIFLHFNNADFIFVLNSFGNYITSNNFNSKYNGKTRVVTLVANGLGQIAFYNNGILDKVSNFDTTINFSQMLSSDNGRFNGKIYNHVITSHAPTAQEVAQEHALLRSIYPEIENVRIGEQTWATSNCEMAATPMGNVIAEMQAAANLNFIPTLSFNSVAGWSIGAGYSLDTTNGLLNSDGTANNTLFKPSSGIVTGKWYKVTVNVTVYTSGNFFLYYGGNRSSTINSSGLHTFYIQAGSSNNYAAIWGSFLNATISNYTIYEIGWSGSQELYDGIYAQTAEAASSVEKITNGVALVDSNGDNLPDGFSSWSIPNLSIVTGNGFSGRAVRMINNTGMQSITTLNSSRYYKVSFEYRGNGARIAIGGGNDIQLPVNTGDAIKYTVYSKGGSGNGLYLVDSAVDLWAEYGNISVKELGLSDATSIANYTYAAVKAASMWCHYGGTGTTAIDNGAIYGKLYNWFAVKLLQMDIDYYNAANPSAMWGWRVPTRSDFQQLSTYLGGDAVSGGKLKKEGTAYWNSPNTGATNVSGFSFLGCGNRTNGGSFIDLNIATLIYDIQGGSMMVLNGTTGISYPNVDGRYGFSLRLIKTTQ